MLEIRFHGRGGQGTVIASKLLAVAVASEGQYVQAFPEFGVERRGAPVTAFLRIDRSPIYHRYRIYEPHHVVILDPTLLTSIDLTKGLHTGGWIIVNSEKEPKDLSHMGKFQVATVDANAIALRHGLGSQTAPIVNTAILGAVVKVLGLCRLSSLAEAIREEAPIKQAENAAAASESHELVRGLDYAVA
jgi:2-oxoisovalerate ferredoxin oxidoreductase gamma subunit